MQSIEKHIHMVKDTETFDCDAKLHVTASILNVVRIKAGNAVEQIAVSNNGRHITFLFRSDFKKRKQSNQCDGCCHHEEFSSK